MFVRLLGCAGVAAMTVVAALAVSHPAEAAFCDVNNCGTQVTSSASAAYTPDANGVFGGNPGGLASSAQVLAGILGVDQGLVTGLDKSDDGPGALGTLTASPSNGKEGTWSYTPKAPSTLAPNYLLVKAGNFFTVWAFGAATSGAWSTAPITVGSGNQPDLSHLTALAVTPIPGAAFLLAPALLGLAGLRRRQRREVLPATA
jgi:hypothetical protein